MSAVAAAEARASLPELLTRVEDGEEITITRHGRAVAVLIRPAALRSRRASTVLGDASRIREMVDSAGTGIPEDVGLTAQRAEELIAAIKSGRDSR